MTNENDLSVQTTDSLARDLETRRQFTDAYFGLRDCGEEATARRLYVSPSWSALSFAYPELSPAELVSLAAGTYDWS